MAEGWTQAEPPDLQQLRCGGGQPAPGCSSTLRCPHTGDSAAACPRQASRAPDISTPPSDLELQPQSRRPGAGSPPPPKRPRVPQPGQRQQPAGAAPAAAAAASGLQAAPPPPPADTATSLPQAPRQQAQGTQAGGQRQPAAAAAAPEPGSSWEAQYRRAQQPPALEDSAGLAAGLLVLTNTADIPGAIAEIERVARLPSPLPGLLPGPLPGAPTLARHYCQGCNQHISFLAFVQVGAGCCRCCCCCCRCCCCVGRAAPAAARVHSSPTRASRSARLLRCRAHRARLRQSSCASGAPPAGRSRQPARQAPRAPPNCRPAAAQGRLPRKSSPRRQCRQQARRPPACPAGCPRPPQRLPSPAARPGPRSA
jgi:hypothetical protein